MAVVVLMEACCCGGIVLVRMLRCLLLRRMCVSDVTRVRRQLLVQLWRYPSAVRRWMERPLRGLWVPALLLHQKYLLVFGVVRANARLGTFQACTCRDNKREGEPVTELLP